jgi:tetratricopeptide (TPR) repeat protein
MAYHSDFDFVGDYDHGQQAGMMHVANHHVVPGKKQWTWGNSDFGQAWDRQLTDADGPYIELMCGAYTDNQPDFSWIMPGEEKRFTQIFMPYKAIGPAKNANRDAVVNFELEGSSARAGVYVTQPRQALVQLRYLGTLVWEKAADLSPERALIETIELPAGARPQQLTLRVLDALTGRELIAFTPLPGERAPIPSPATPAKPPSAITSNEELFLNGLHLEQYRHATYAPEPYYEEALRRDPLDSRCSNALGLLLYRRGKFAAAEPFFRTAIASLTRRNPNPYDGEPYYNLGLALKMQGRLHEAFDALYKAAWSAAWQDAAYFELARLAARLGDHAQALDLADQALRRNWTHHKARHLKVALLRHAGQPEQALKQSMIALELDPMDFGVLWERQLLAGDGAFDRYARANTSTCVEIGLDYMHAGLYPDAVALFERVADHDTLATYFSGECQTQHGDLAGARATFERAAARSPDYVFPHRIESVLALQRAIELNPSDARAPYYLGNFWYAHRRYAEAIGCWERAAELDPTFPTAQRNLGLAYFNKLHQPEHARAAYARAFELNPDDARVLFELDQLEKKLNQAPQARLERLEQYPHLVARRDDLTVEYITLLNMLGQHDRAYAALMARRFHPWEGGEGKSTGQYVASLVEQAKRLIAAGEHAQAIKRLERALAYPHNLGEGKLPNAQENNIHYYLGLAWAGQGDSERARAAFERASTGLSEPTSAMYYNDQPPDMIFYQGLARQQLGRADEARQIFQKLVDYGQSHMGDDVQMDYFAVSLPTFLVFDEDLNERNRIHCTYMMALGYLGLGDAAEARRCFDRTLELDANHQGAIMHRQLAI